MMRTCEPPTAAGSQVWDRLTRGLYPTGGSAFRRCQVVDMIPWPSNREALLEADEKL